MVEFHFPGGVIDDTATVAVLDLESRRRLHIERHHSIVCVAAEGGHDWYILCAELYDAPELRRRIARVENRGYERIDFYCLIYVTSGRYSHFVDFETVRCAAGSCVILRPGMVHRFGAERDWEGWVLILRSELLPPRSADVWRDPKLSERLHSLPECVHTTGTTSIAIKELLERAFDDTAMAHDQGGIGELLVAQFDVLVLRLHLAQLAATTDLRIEPRLVERYRAFLVAVEREFQNWHTMAKYAHETWMLHQESQQSDSCGQ